MNNNLTLSGLNFFRFRKINPEEYLLTNDSGQYLFLDEEEFLTIRNNLEDIPEKTYRGLLNSGFIFTPENAAEQIRTYREKNSFLSYGPSLHIVVLTLRCNHKCVYCQASRKDMDSDGYDMDNATVEKTVDFILQTSAVNICIEFQGGEPLANFDVLKHAIDYAKQKNNRKNIIFSVVTNLSLMDEEKFQFLEDNEVSICTSLDGPEKLHNKNRTMVSEGNSFASASKWIKRLAELNRQKEKQHSKFNRTNALLTVTRETLSSPREIIDQYVELGFSSVSLRAMNPFGFGAALSKAKNHYSPEDFLVFYKESLDYIIELNKSGTEFFEKTAQIILHKVINKHDPNYLDLRSPCGAGIGQLAYNYDGKIFTCDEGRMVSERGDDLFLLGTVQNSTYSDVVTGEKSQNMCVASCLEGLPGCNDCAYNPYCGVCPVYNYVEQGTIFGQMPTNQRCTIFMGIHDYLFSKIREEYDIFEKWLELH